MFFEFYSYCVIFLILLILLNFFNFKSLFDFFSIIFIFIFFFIFINFFSYFTFSTDFFQWEAFTFFDKTNISFFISAFISFFFFCVLLTEKPSEHLYYVYLYILSLFVLTLFLLTCQSFFIIILLFECILFISINLLRFLSKSEKILEAVSEMFLWTLFGSIFLLLFLFFFLSFYSSFYVFFLYKHKLSLFYSSLLLIGFGVKIPLWPFYSWLLKAHVEASTEFSILLSGFIVKIGIFCFSKFFQFFFNLYFFNFLFFIILIGITDAIIKLFLQHDLKKIIALLTIIETNWIILCFLINDSLSDFIFHSLIIIHSFSTTCEFLLVDCITKRFNSRDIFLINNIWNQFPILWYFSFYIVLSIIGFPGSSVFLLKFLFLSNILSISVIFFFFFAILFLLVLPLFFIRLWVPIWFSFYNKFEIKNNLDVSVKEFLIFFSCICASFCFGLYPNLLNFILL